MADKATRLILDALTRAVHDPGGVPLLGQRATPGLFPATALARQAAERCKREGLVRVIRTETRGRNVQEVCVLTDKGLEYLLGDADPRHVLEDFVRVLEARQAQVERLADSARQMEVGLQSLRTVAERLLERFRPQAGANPATTGAALTGWETSALDALARWHAAGAGASEDCPLPALYRHVQPAHPALTIGQFHDGLRRLHREERIYLHPWTGPLYDLPEPAYALLIGHEVAYYASLR